VQSQLTKSFAGAEAVAQQYPGSSKQITAAAKQSFLDGADWAYTAGVVAILLGATLVFFLFPKKEREGALLERYHAEDTAARVTVDSGVPA
jgi:MFS transporter, DHA2 family, multidrug resistance protein